MSSKKGDAISTMVRIAVIAVAGVLVFFATSLPANAEAPKREPGKISGYMFGDFYDMSQHHNSKIEEMNGLWFRRIYFTYDQKLEKGFAVRFRLELNSPDGFDATKNDTLKPFIKDMYGQYSEGLYSVQFGVIPTPTWESVENWLGYRPVEKTPLDLFKMGEARDTGVSIRGFFAEDKKTGYWLMFGNGSGTKGEIDKGKTIYASLSHKVTPKLTIEAYGDVWNRSAAGSEDWTTLQGFLTYAMPQGKAGALYATQNRSVKGAPDVDISVFSIYADYWMSERAAPMVRVDFVSDPVPSGDKIAYLPLATNAKPTLYIFGIRYNITDFFYLVPNIEMVKYSKPTNGTPTPKDATVYRLTFYWGWK